MRVLLRVLCMAGLILAAPVLAQEQQTPLMGSEAEPGDPEALSALAATAADPAAGAPAGFGGADGIYRIIVIGDTLSKGLGAGLTRATESDPRFEVVNRFFESSGLARPQVHDWPNALPKILETQNFDAVVIWLGSNDRQPIRSDAGQFDFNTPLWQVAYRQQADLLLQQAAAQRLKVFWLKLPVMADPAFDADMKAISAIHGAALEAAKLAPVDLAEVFANTDGSFKERFTDGENFGQRLRLRDGINFTKQANSLLGLALLAEIKRREGLSDAPSTVALAPVASAVPDVPPEGPAVETQSPDVIAPSPVVATSPLFGQDDGLGGELAFDAASVREQKVAVITTPEIVDAAAPAPLSFAPGSQAEKFFKTGDAGVAPPGRFDDFSYTPP